MGGAYGYHHLNEEQKELIENHMKLMWWYMYKYVLGKEMIEYHEMEDCASQLMWFMCISAEKYDPDRDVRFTTYLMKAFYYGAHKYLKLRNRNRSREFLTDWQYKFDDGESGSYEPEDRPHRFTTWKNVSRLLGMVNMSVREKAVMRLCYKEGYAEQKIAPLIGVHRSRVGQIKQIVIDRIKRRIADKDIVKEDFYEYQ
jgi:RNA polymerase sigma factor (sigma-70 family)